ncbi:MAG TPA: hypothetical protein VJB89_02335 [Candidatus Nanoarchaeia archaeon]|nr:hypothetical protein [Candidatus Nanoarchaeia archaeon]
MTNKEIILEEIINLAKNIEIFSKQGELNFTRAEVKQFLDSIELLTIELNNLNRKIKKLKVS